MKHGPSAYNRGCRCDVCREIHRQRGAETRARLAARPREDVPHGLSGYKNWSCRCETCTAAHSEWLRRAATVQENGRKTHRLPAAAYADQAFVELQGYGKRLAWKGRPSSPAGQP